MSKNRDPLADALIAKGRSRGPSHDFRLGDEIDALLTRAAQDKLTARQILDWLMPLVEREFPHAPSSASILANALHFAMERCATGSRRRLSADALDLLSDENMLVSQGGEPNEAPYWAPEDDFESFGPDSDDEREWLDGCDTRIEKIEAAIKTLYDEDDAHWEPDGQPRIRAVEMLSGLRNVTREEIETAVPGYDRFHHPFNPRNPEDPYQPSTRLGRAGRPQCEFIKSGRGIARIRLSSPRRRMN